MRAFDAGQREAKRVGLEPGGSLRPLVQALGLEVVPWRFAGRVREVIVDGVVGVDAGAPRPWARWLVAHAAGHHLLHTGSSLYLDSWRWVERSKAERQAEEFAAGLLLAALAQSPSPAALARRACVPVPKAEWAWRLLTGESHGA
jgi:hypothetical protein